MLILLAILVELIGDRTAVLLIMWSSLGFLWSTRPLGIQISSCFLKFYDRIVNRILATPYSFTN